MSTPNYPNGVVEFQGDWANVNRTPMLPPDEAAAYARARKLARDGRVEEGRALIAHDEKLLSLFDRQQRIHDGQQRERERMLTERREALALPASPWVPMSSRRWPK